MLYCTALRVAKVFALIWDDIDFYNKTISINKNILKKNQEGGRKQRHISSNSTTIWYFGICKTETSYRTIPIVDTINFWKKLIFDLRNVFSQIQI